VTEQAPTCKSWYSWSL